MGPGIARSAWSFSGSWCHELYGPCLGILGFLNMVPPEVPWLAIPFVQILCFYLRVTGSPVNERKAFCEPHHMQNKASKWAIKENASPGPHGEEHFRAERCLRLRLKGPAQVEIIAQENRTEKGEGRPKIGLSLLDERLFSLLPCSLWWESWLATNRSCRQGRWPHWKSKWEPSLVFGNMCTREMIPTAKLTCGWYKPN